MENLLLNYWTAFCLFRNSVRFRTPFLELRVHILLETVVSAIETLSLSFLQNWLIAHSIIYVMFKAVLLILNASTVSGCHFSSLYFTALKNGHICLKKTVNLHLFTATINPSDSEWTSPFLIVRELRVRWARRVNISVHPLNFRPVTEKLRALWRNNSMLALHGEYRGGCWDWRNPPSPLLGATDSLRTAGPRALSPTPRPGSPQTKAWGASWGPTQSSQNSC